MNSLLIITISLSIFAMGYHFYSKFIADNIILTINGFLIFLIFWMIFEGIIHVRKIYLENE